MNQFRENLSSLLEDGLPMSFSELQYKYESAFGPLDEPICTLENIRRLGTVQNSILTQILVSFGHPKKRPNDLI